MQKGIRNRSNKNIGMKGCREAAFSSTTLQIINFKVRKGEIWQITLLQVTVTNNGTV
jgi:hypothetical protein